MSRSPKSSSPRRAGYPRLATAWKLLVGAAPLALSSVASADATVPRDAKAPKEARAPKQQSPKPPSPKPTERHRPPMLMGGPMRVLPPPLPREDPLREVEPHVLLLHPHAPDEPCLDFRGRRA